jgi:hypothetical protein
MAKLVPGWQPLATGSVPYGNAEHAWTVALRYFPLAPCWPQLPRRSYLENMYVQFSEGFPGAVLEDQHLYVDRREDLDPGLERLYLAYLEDDLTYGATSADYAEGLAALQQSKVVLSPGITLLQGQVTGPISWGLTVVDHNHRPLLYDEVLADAIAKHLRLKAAWQERALAARAGQTLLMIDEPYLSAFGSAFVSLSREQALHYLGEVLAGLKGLKGIHCCGHTDWSLLLETPIDVLSLDAYNHGATLARYPGQVTAFLQRGGTVAWGIVPATDAVESETAPHLADRLDETLRTLTDSGVPRDLLLRGGLVTPSCGVGSLSVLLAERVFDLTVQVASMMRERYATVEVQPS